MRSNTKLAVVVALFALAVVSSAAMAQGTGIWNYSTGMQKDVKGLLDDGSGSGTIVTRFWAAGEVANHNSGSLPSTGQLLTLGPDTYLVWSDWTNQGVHGTPPDATHRTVFLYSVENQGLGQFLLMSVGYDDVLGGFDFDHVTNGNVVSVLAGRTPPLLTARRGPRAMLAPTYIPYQETPLSVPQLSVAEVVEDESGLQVSLAWNPLINLKGFFDSSPQNNLVTGAVVRYRCGFEEPTTHRASEWKVAENGVLAFGTSGTDPGAATVRVPLPPTGMKVFLALSLLFDGAVPGDDGTTAFAETSFLGGSVSLAAGNPAPSFRSLAAQSALSTGLKVTWTLDNFNTSSSSFTVYGAGADGAAYVPLPGTLTAPAGPVGTYTFTASAPYVRFVRVDVWTPSAGTVSSAPTPVVR